MTKYYVRFNYSTKEVEVFNRKDDSLVQSVSVVNGVIDTVDLEQIANALDITTEDELEDLDYDIFYEDREGREALQKIS